MWFAWWILCMTQPAKVAFIAASLCCPELEKNNANDRKQDSTDD
jgi:hypothetical protein